MSDGQEESWEVPREVQLEQAILCIEHKCARLDMLISAERSSGHAQMASRIMAGEVWAMRLLIAKAKGEF